MKVVFFMQILLFHQIIHLCLQISILTLKYGILIFVQKLVKFVKVFYKMDGLLLIQSRLLCFPCKHCSALLSQMNPRISKQLSNIKMIDSYMNRLPSSGFRIMPQITSSKQRLNSQQKWDSKRIYVEKLLNYIITTRIQL